MENSEAKKVAKPTSKKSNSAAIRVALETRKRLLAELAKINKKQYGKRVKIDALLLKLLFHLSAKDVIELQEASLTGRDRMEQSFRAYCSKVGQITMDEYLELLLKSDGRKIESQNATVS
ncbi:MAG: hypothetical protein B7Y39_11540 [Bdellovibrio sp. 28-41-41]|nr:MAG: hypothetical protein B7Y39_11540 [Bdellovibrio sp. 28-41-41]